MSSDLPSADPSSGPEADPGPPPSAGAHAPAELELSLASRAKARGAELLDGLERHWPGALRHADGTASYGFAIAVELGLERDHAEAVREAARLHELGAIYVPVAVMAKPSDDQTSEERSLVDSRPRLGADLARGAGVPGQICDWVQAFGERFDGRGRAGLAGERIPLESRIIRVACVCDAALAAPPPNAADRPRDIAVARLRQSAGRDLDPRVVGAVVAVLDRISGGG